MKISAFASHAAAAAVSMATLTVIPIVLYIALSICGGVLHADWGGPLNIVLVPLLSLLFAAVSTGCSMLLAIGLQALRRRTAVPAWIPVPVLFMLAWGGTFLFARSAGNRGQEDVQAAAVIGAIIDFCFCAYWIPLMLAGKILDLIKRWKGGPD